MEITQLIPVMATLKPSSIKKNPDIKPETVSSYHPYVDMVMQLQPEITDVTAEHRKDLIARIGILPKEDHWMIYKLLMKSAISLTTNKMGTFFNLNDLDCTAFWQLYKLVQLSCEHEERERSKQEALNEYTQLKNQQLPADKLTETSISDHPISNPTEEIKFQQMISMQRGGQFPLAPS